VAYVHKTPIGMRRPRKPPQGGGPKTRSKVWYEVSCSNCHYVVGVSLGSKGAKCPKCKEKV